ncbi:pectin lyase-like protein [Gloeophyllum trabeum ATCC 11539]|uniref:galacturonan 1,4-alpha-galacturonidase n=1 Tax=Gloeophyllum trabeum (strain ATCC 11539 / FP-39264 / Madison 617) TaxID=670483 RepID=S7Q702_GLOTA|nr:pectin lyase-like protein [Gloeophyllum trabeum ATCC 11539]EPQ55213.1 pectin lyase-like protein [Gloeophyllum trabeum ATCC 11539]
MGTLHFLAALALLLVWSAISALASPADACTLNATGGDDAPNFVQAYFACDTVIIPESTVLNIGTRMNMTGGVNKHIDLQGTIKFTSDINYWSGNGYYFAFQDQITFWKLGGENIRLDGGGVLDGTGQPWYDAFASNSSLLRPILLTISQGRNVVVKDITMLNGPEWINFVTDSSNVTYDNIHINASSTSSHLAKNTDGWDIYRSDGVVIQNSVINNGDDCVSFKPNSTNILVSNLNCNGSHGISVGSLGQYAGEYDIVENVTSINIRMANAENGARIKAFAGPNVGSGIVKNITFQNFSEMNVDYPVVIDQCYMTAADVCAAYPSNTYIQDVWFTNISGTSSGNEKSLVASLDCSPDNRCSNINVNDLNLSAPAKYQPATYGCQNVNLTGNAASLFGTCATT